MFGGLASIRLALLGGYALGIVEQLVVGYVDPQYNLIIALGVMLILIGWRSRGELAHMSSEAATAKRQRRRLVTASAVSLSWRRRPRWPAGCRSS